MTKKERKGKLSLFLYNQFLTRNFSKISKQKRDVSKLPFLTSPGKNFIPGTMNLLIHGTSVYVQSLNQNFPSSTSLELPPTNTLNSPGSDTKFMLAS